MIVLDLMDVGYLWLKSFAGGYAVGLTVYIVRRVGDAL